jgi:hypothetical protein
VGVFFCENQGVGAQELDVLFIELMEGHFIFISSSCTFELPVDLYACL